MMLALETIVQMKKALSPYVWDNELYKIIEYSPNGYTLQKIDGTLFHNIKEKEFQVVKKPNQFHIYLCYTFCFNDKGLTVDMKWSKTKIGFNFTNLSVLDEQKVMNKVYKEVNFIEYNGKLFTNEDIQNGVYVQCSWEMDEEFALTNFFRFDRWYKSVNEIKEAFKNTWVEREEFFKLLPNGKFLQVYIED